MSLPVRGCGCGKFLQAALSGREKPFLTFARNLVYSFEGMVLPHI